MIYTTTKIIEMYEMESWFIKRGWAVKAVPLYTYLDNLTLAQWSLTPRQELIFRLMFSQAIDDEVQHNIKKAEGDLIAIQLINSHGG